MADYCFRPRLISPNVLRVSKEGKGTIEPYFHCNCEGFRVIGFDPCVQFELCLDSQKKYPTNRKRAFDPSDQRLVFRSGGGGTRTTLENTGKTDASKVRGTPALRLDQLPINAAPETDLLAIAKQSLESSRQAVEKLIGFIPPDDQFALGILGPILAEIRTAQANIDRLTSQIA